MAKYKLPTLPKKKLDIQELESWQQDSNLRPADYKSTSLSQYIALCSLACVNDLNYIRLYLGHS